MGKKNYIQKKKTQKKREDTKGVIRSRQQKNDCQYNGQEKKVTWTNNKCKTLHRKSLE